VVSRPDAIAALLRPSSIAVIGATPDPTRVGGMPISFLKAVGYPGEVYPVNSRYSEIQGLPAFRSVGSIGKPIDMALVMVRADLTPGVVRECAAAGVSVAVVISGGFAETGPAGRALQEELAAIARTSGIRICGPNCAGVMSVPGRLAATFGSHLAGDQRLVEGNISIISQSGAVGAYIFSLARQRGIGLQHWVTTGNEADLDLSEIAGALAAEPATRVIALYIEQIRDAQRLAAACEIGQRTRTAFVALLAGRTEAATQSLQSHTAAMLGDRAVASAALREYGVATVDSMEGLLKTSAALAADRPPRGRRVGLVSISGAAGVLMVDRCTERGLEVPSTPPALQAELKELLPYAGTSNPLDVTGNISNSPDLFREFVDRVLAEQTIDVVVCFLGHVVLSPSVGPRFVAELIELSAAHQKPIWLVAMDDPEHIVSSRTLEHGMALLEDPTGAIDALALAVHLQDWFDAVDLPQIWDRRRDKPSSPPPSEVPTGRTGVLDELEAQKLLVRAGIAFPVQTFVAVDGEIDGAIKDLQEPFVLKIVAEGLAHKSAVGGVELDVTRETIKRKFRRLIARVAQSVPTATIRGVLVQEQHAGTPVIIGTRIDPTFGPAIRVGEGGVDAEDHRTGAVALVPVDDTRAREMFRELRDRGVLARARPDQLDGLATAVVGLSRVAWETRGSVASLEVNPLLLNERGATAVDALVELTSDGKEKGD